MRKFLGTGAEVHGRAVAALFSWKLLAIGGLEVFSQAVRAEPHTDVAILSRHFGIWSLDFCRVIYVLQAQREKEGTVERTGFAYGTLPGHAVKGEELFSIEWRPATEDVWCDIFSFSLPANLLVSLAAPLARATQVRFARASLEKAVLVSQSGPQVTSQNYPSAP